MRVRPYRRKDNPDQDGIPYEPCLPSEATHINFNTPGPFFNRWLPVTLEDASRPKVWKWNGDVEKPTITPSILTRDGQGTVCHSYVTDGRIHFLPDSTHELAGQTVDLLEVDE